MVAMGCHVEVHICVMSAAVFEPVLAKHQLDVRRRLGSELHWISTQVHCWCTRSYCRGASLCRRVLSQKHCAPLMHFRPKSWVLQSAGEVSFKEGALPLSGNRFLDTSCCIYRLRHQLCSLRSRVTERQRSLWCNLNATVCQSLLAFLVLRSTVGPNCHACLVSVTCDALSTYLLTCSTHSFIVGE